MKVEITKLTDTNLLRKANSFTSGKESKMNLAKAYSMGHSPIRTQLFAIEMTDIPLFVASQFVRSHVGVDWFQRSKRTDRGGKDFTGYCEAMVDDLSFAIENDDVNAIKSVADDIAYLPKEYDRYAPTNLMCIINAEALINLAHKRLCSKASREATEVFKAIKEAIEKVDPDLAKHLVPTCIFRGGICPEVKPCGHNKNEEALGKYKALFLK